MQATQAARAVLRWTARVQGRACRRSATGRLQHVGEQDRRTLVQACMHGDNIHDRSWQVLKAMCLQ